MPESGTYGSVRGLPGNRHPYRDRQHINEDGHYKQVIANGRIE